MASRCVVEVDLFAKYTKGLEKALVTELRHAGGAIVDGAKVHVIRSHAIDTGALYDGIAFVYSGKGLNAYVVSAVKDKRDYPIYVHEGTRFMKARPYLAQAVKDYLPELNRRMADLVRNI